MNKTTKWTVTSPNGQTLYGETCNNGKDVNMTSRKGNHGQVQVSVWMTKLDDMKQAGYTVEES